MQISKLRLALFKCGDIYKHSNFSGIHYYGFQNIYYCVLKHEWLP